jgi:hypothetical protein
MDSHDHIAEAEDTTASRFRKMWCALRNSKNMEYDEQRMNTIYVPLAKGGDAADSKPSRLIRMTMMTSAVYLEQVSSL